MIDDKDRKVLDELKKGIPAEVRNHIKKIWVYGSRVRGDSQDDSDLDVLALIDKKDPLLERKLEDVAYQVMWNCDFNPIISLKVFLESHFQDALSKGYSFYRNVASEGVEI